MAKIVLTEKNYEQAVKEDSSLYGLELKFQGLIGLSFGMGIERGSIGEAIGNLEKEAERFGATHIFNLHYQTAGKTKEYPNASGRYEAIGDAYGPNARNL